METLNCHTENRRNALFGNAQWNGIDFLEVSDDQRSLCVHFFGNVPQTLRLENIVIQGGQRIRDVRAIKVEMERAADPELDDCVRITLDKPGDFSVYRLCLREKVPHDGNYLPAQTEGVTYRTLSGFDPRYACLDFRFKLDCPSDFDCKPEPVCEPEPQTTPEINYLAKDYASFRQLMLDRLALTIPEWRERHVPDLGITLVELLAYVADHLSYYQDAVATEAYLDTARQRISVRRHTRLVGYSMHEGNNARAWLTLFTDSDSDLPIDVYFITMSDELVATGKCVMKETDLSPQSVGAYEIYEPLLDPDATSIAIYAAHSEIYFYTWGDIECCISRGATRATLLDGAPYPAEGEPDPASRTLLHLKVGDVLVFEEVKGSTTGNPADADPAHRHAVRLTRVDHAAVDGLLRQLLVEIEWDREDALPFDLCLSTRLPAPDCRLIENVSVARGNVILVDHGKTVYEEIGAVRVKTIVDECACEGSVTEVSIVPEKFTAILKQAPLTHVQPRSANASASMQIAQDPRAALPQVNVIGRLEGPPETCWSARPDLLASTVRDAHFVAEMDDEGRAHLRFDTELGPPAYMSFAARYRIGNGSVGNVAAEAIGCLVVRNGAISGTNIRPRNPLPAQGGMAAESAMEAKLAAPHAFRSQMQRAITADDYAQLAARHGQLQRAAAQLVWMGSWYEVRVALDPYGAEPASPELCNNIATDLHRYRRMGHDLAVVPARYVPLEIVLQVCVQGHFLRGHVAAALAGVFGSTRLRDGTLGFFHPDRLSFGGSIYASEIIAMAQAVEGVESVRLTTLQRFGEPTRGELAQGVLKLASAEIPQLDNDPNFPEHGKLTINLGGGR